MAQLFTSYTNVLEHLHLSKEIKALNKNSSQKELSDFYKAAMKCLGLPANQDLPVSVGRVYQLRPDGLYHSRNHGEFMLMPVDKGLERLTKEFFNPTTGYLCTRDILLEDKTITELLREEFVSPATLLDDIESLGSPEDWTFRSFEKIYQIFKLVASENRDERCISSVKLIESDAICIPGSRLNRSSIKDSQIIHLIPPVSHAKDFYIRVSLYDGAVSAYNPIKIDLDTVKKVFVEILMEITESYRSKPRVKHVVNPPLDRSSKWNLTAPEVDPVDHLIDASTQLFKNLAAIPTEGGFPPYHLLNAHVGLLIALLENDSAYRRTEDASYMINDHDGEKEIVFCIKGVLGKAVYNVLTNETRGIPVNTAVDIHHVLQELCTFFLKTK